MSTKYSSLHFSPALPSVPIGILPPLPRIRSEQIQKRVFTHTSLAGENRYGFQAPESDPSTDNEELAQIGDQTFSLAVTDLIQDLYPYLRVGPASKLRDQMKRKSMIAEICVSYGLHKRINLPERHANSLRATQSVQVNVFKAYVGGVYRDQGLEVAKKWLILVIQPHVEAAYQNIRNNHHLPEANPRPRVPQAPYPSPPSSASSDGAGPAFRRRDPDNRYRSLPPRVNVPQQESGRVSGGIERQPENIEQSRSNRRRRRSSQGNSGSGDPDHTWSPHCRTGSDGSERTSKRQRY